MTDHLVDLAEAKWLKTIKTLRNVKLSSRKQTQQGHPRLPPAGARAFWRALAAALPAGLAQRHTRLYDYYKNLPEKHLPDTLTEMEPLFAAVAHGCLAGKHKEAEEDILFNRIRRRDQFYTFHKLGAYGADLAAVSSFFDVPWRQLSSGFNDDVKANILAYSGFGLRALGRLREAAEPMREQLKARIQLKDWRNAATAAGSLSELFLTLGQVTTIYN